MSVDIFKDTRTNLPDNDARIVRVPFNKSDLGNRPAQQAAASSKADNRFSIRHVSNPRSK
jgi:hypothetical protein